MFGGMFERARKEEGALYTEPQLMKERAEIREYRKKNPEMLKMGEMAPEHRKEKVKEINDAQDNEEKYEEQMKLIRHEDRERLEQLQVQGASQADLSMAFRQMREEEVNRVKGRMSTEEREEFHKMFTEDVTEAEREAAFEKIRSEVNMREMMSQMPTAQRNAMAKMQEMMKNGGDMDGLGELLDEVMTPGDTPAEKAMYKAAKQMQEDGKPEDEITAFVEAEKARIEAEVLARTPAPKVKGMKKGFFQ